jgi:hypothetical protein
MASGTARSGGRGGRNPSNRGRGRGRGRGRATTRGRARGGGRGGRGSSRGRRGQGQRRTPTRDSRNTPDGCKPHGVVSVLLRDYSHENLQEKAGRSVLHKAPIRSGIRRSAPPSLHLHLPLPLRHPPCHRLVSHFPSLQMDMCMQPP